MDMFKYYGHIKQPNKINELLRILARLCRLNTEDLLYSGPQKVNIRYI